MRGLYRGWGATLCVYVPNSMIWWSSYLVMKRGVQERLEKYAFLASCLVLSFSQNALLCLTLQSYTFSSFIFTAILEMLRAYPSI